MAPDIPPGLYRDKDHNYYWNGDGPFPGVTSIIGIKDKSQPLMGFAAKHSANYALDHIKELNDLLLAGGREDAYKLITAAYREYTDRAAHLGSRVHSYFEQHGLGADLPPILPDEQSRVDRYTKWVEKYQPHFIYNEFMVISLDHQYGGTGDVFFELWCTLHLKWCLWLVDYKTGNNIYPTTALQLAGLQNAEFMAMPLSPEKQLPVPIADHYGVFHIGPTNCDLVEFEVGAEEWDAFRYARGLYGWSKNREPLVQHKRTYKQYGVPA